MSVISEASISSLACMLAKKKKKTGEEEEEGVNGKSFKKTFSLHHQRRAGLKSVFLRWAGGTRATSR